MARSKSKQMISGKAFEYALLFSFEQKLKDKTNVSVIHNSSFSVAKECFEQLSTIKQSENLLYASFAVNFLEDLEPRLSRDLGQEDILQLEIMQDSTGEDGDVRDVLAIRSLQKWEIGVSAKNNHSAVKHSRLSNTINFGDKWMGVKNSNGYFKTITPIFDNLEKIKKKSHGKETWKNLGNHHDTVYIPILRAFEAELKKLYQENGKNVIQNLISYLVGTKDFYKVIKKKGALEIVAYNLYGSLNLPFKNIQPTYKTEKITLPTEIINFGFKKNSKTTLILELNNDWGLSFRIHNASSKVEPSLKFDINLLKSPKNLFRNILKIN